MTSFPWQARAQQKLEKMSGRKIEHFLTSAKFELARLKRMTYKRLCEVRMKKRKTRRRRRRRRREEEEEEEKKKKKKSCERRVTVGQGSAVAIAGGGVGVALRLCC